MAHFRWLTRSELLHAAWSSRRSMKSTLCSTCLSWRRDWAKTFFLMLKLPPMDIVGILRPEQSKYWREELKRRKLYLWPKYSCTSKAKGMKMWHGRSYISFKYLTHTLWARCCERGGYIMILGWQLGGRRWCGNFGRLEERRFMIWWNGDSIWVN